MPSDPPRAVPLVRLLLAGVAMLAALVGPQVLSQAAPTSVTPTPEGLVAARPAPTLGGIDLDDAVLTAEEVAERIAYQDEVADRVDRARGHARSCGQTRYAAARPLRRSTELDVASAGHALAMGQSGYFDHVAPGGVDPSERAQAQGYRGLVSENIAAGHRGPAAVVRAWLRSPAHCAIVMSPGARSIGVGFARVVGSTYGTYWVMTVGTRG